MNNEDLVAEFDRRHREVLRELSSTTKSIVVSYAISLISSVANGEISAEEAIREIQNLID